MELIKVLTAGNVDDGKSTLIGRLLYETGNLSTEESLLLESGNPSQSVIPLAKLLDGLKDEQEQGITIDVAYRFFYSQNRRFTIADCPGHVQYLKNLVVGAANSQVALILIDATRGVVEQTLRHLKLLQLLRIPHVLFVVNKMDLVNFDERKFNEIVFEVKEKIEVSEESQFSFIPISAQLGDNVVKPSQNMDWFHGATVLEYLERAPVCAYNNDNDFRVVVQKTLLDPEKKIGAQRAYAARVFNGALKTGDRVQIYPSGETSRVSRVFEGQNEISKAQMHSSIAVILEDDLDIQRGNLLGPVGSNCFCADSLIADVFWLDSKPLLRGSNYLLRHTCQETFAKAEVADSEIEVSDPIDKHQLAQVKFRCAQSIWFDSYVHKSETGIVLIIDPSTFNVAGIGLVRGN